ncbi:MAG: DUF2157 domain-containing protein, partial [Bryobacteraceae bacterium]
MSEVPKERSALDAQMERWTEASLLDGATAERILAFEAKQAQRAILRWPVFLAVGFGWILIAAGIILFVATYWDKLSPTVRSSVLLILVAVFHASGIVTRRSFPPLSTTLH